MTAESEWDNYDELVEELEAQGSIKEMGEIRIGRVVIETHGDLALSLTDSVREEDNR